MILPGNSDKPQSPNLTETLYDDAPPAYDASQITAPPAQEKLSQSVAGPSVPQIPTSSGSTTPNSASSSTFKTAAAWFSFGALSRTDKEVKATVIGLVRDVVKHPSSAASVSILQSCAEACRARNLSFDSILQEKSIEEHTPLYWAILKHKGPLTEHEIRVLDILVAFPLKISVRSDACAACVIQSDNDLFQWLVRSPGWKPRKQRGMEEMLLGEIPKDIIVVENDLHAANTGAFKAHVHVASFQRRFRVSQQIRLEFIARERMWAVVFSREKLPSPSYDWKTSTSGYVSVHLMEHSPSTPLRARILIKESNKRAEGTPRQITILLKTSSHSDLKAQSESGTDGIGFALDEAAGASSLQYDGSTYINEDGSLDFTMEGVLTRKDDPECTIM